MNVKIYHIEYNKIKSWLVPGRIFRGRLLAYLSIVISTVVFLYQDVLRFRKRKLYELMITPQVCYLERLLNDRFDFTQRRIRIVDGIDKPPFYIYQQAELKPKYIKQTTENAPRIIYTSGESAALQDDFIIKVPGAIVFEEAEMRSLVKAYKLAGIKFKIQRT